MTSRRKLEKDIEDECCAIAEDEQWLTPKLEYVGRSWPDRLFLGPMGEHFIVEFKRPGEKVRPQQQARIDMLRTRGHTVHVIDSVTSFRDVLQRASAVQPFSSPVVV